MKLRVYLDTNVYRHITQCDEAKAVRDTLQRLGAIAVASSSNLVETYAISNHRERDGEIRTLTRVASAFERYPQTWHQAMEVRGAVLRHHRDWLRPLSFTGRARDFLTAHRIRWDAARRGELPDPHSYAQFRRDFEDGVASRAEGQKSRRKERLSAMSSEVAIIDARSGVRSSFPIDLSDPETYWRAECLLAWSHALNDQNPSTRDYADWLRPFLRNGAFSSHEYPQFWLQEISSTDCPKNRLSGLVSFYQLDFKITHGNAADAQHACHALDADIFLTADRAFFDSLAKTARHYSRFARICFVERGSLSVLPFIQKALAPPE